MVITAAHAYLLVPASAGALAVSTGTTIITTATTRPVRPVVFA
ncbi:MULTISPECIES: hypothetical protein [Stenotrophomonas]|jgi:hypothetical protein|nr:MULTISPECIES: hypothetical protein [Stenotrophomonas]